MMPRHPVGFYAASILGAALALGCHVSRPLPMPDAASGRGLTFGATPASLVIRPSASGQLRFLLHDQDGRPVGEYPVDFAIVDNRPDQVSAKLSNEHSLTDLGGEAIVEIIV